METATELPSRRGRCPRGFSVLQIVVLSVLKAHHQVIAYWQIAQLILSDYGLQTTEGAVRGALERMFRRGFIIRRRAANGQMQGNRYAFSTDPCPHIRPYAPSVESGAESDMETTAQFGENATPSILKEKIDRKNLSISSGEKANQKAISRLDALIESDIAFHWPLLVKRRGPRFVQKGSGAIIFVGEIAIKASSVDRAFSMGKLCKRLGDFVPGTYAAEPEAIAPEPVSAVNLDDWQEYQTECKPLPPKPRLDMEGTLLSLLNARQRKERETLPARLGKHPLCILNIARHCLKLQQRDERKKLRDTMRKRQRKTEPRKPGFETWLRAQGRERQAEKWRHRHALEALPPQMQEAPPLPTGQKYDPVKAYAAHRQAVLKDLPNAEPSRLDAYLALCMREKGFNRETVLEAIFQCAPQAQERQDARDWRRYAERATTYAFGITGDMKLAQAAAYREEKRKEAEAEKKQEQQQQEAEKQEESRTAPRVRMR
jgi:hypothetical protein